MKNFRLIGKIDITEIKKEIKDNNIWWNWMSIRKKGFNSRHIFVDDIVLRFQSILLGDKEAMTMNEIDCVDYFIQHKFPKTMHLCRDLANGKTIGRLMIASLGAGDDISEHIDEGPYCQMHDRYHIVIQTNPLVKFRCEHEEVHMPEGTIWWFDNKRVHAVENHGNMPRIHIVMDIKK